MEMADESAALLRISAHPLSADEARDVGIALATALVYLHEQARPLVHRDVKPDNTMRIGARWKLGDFSLMRSVSSRSGARSQSFIGTAEYAPPESYDGLVSPAWDVWSLGILIHEAITGRHPFVQHDESPQQIMRAVCSDEPVFSDDLPHGFRDVLRWCLDKDPSVRWPAERVLEAIEDLDTGSSYLSIPNAQVSRRPKSHSDSPPVPVVSSQQPDDSPGSSELLTVSASGDADCSTLNEAIRCAATGGTILVRPGRYSESLLLDRPISIMGDGAIDEIVVETVGRETLIINSRDVHVRGITMRSRSDMNQPKHHGVTILTGACSRRAVRHILQLTGLYFGSRQCPRCIYQHMYDSRWKDSRGVLQ